MIKANRGNVIIEGLRSDVAADFACIVRSMMSEDVGFTKEEIDELVGDSTKSEKELIDDTAEHLAKALRKIFDEVLADDSKEKSDDKG